MAINGIIGSVSPKVFWGVVVCCVIAVTGITFYQYQTAQSAIISHLETLVAAQQQRLASTTQALGALQSESRLNAVDRKPIISSRVTTVNPLKNTGDCATQAEHFFSYQADSTNTEFSYTNHFSQRLNICFVLIQHGLGPDGNYVSEDLYDAYEGTNYARYEWAPQRNKLWSEIPPMVCTVRGTQCSSRAEFDAQINSQFMQS